MTDKPQGGVTTHHRKAPKSGAAPSGSRDATPAAPWYSRMWSSFSSSDGNGGIVRSVRDTGDGGDGGGGDPSSQSGKTASASSSSEGSGAPSFDASLFDAVCGCGSGRDADGAEPTIHNDIVCGVVVPAAAAGEDDASFDDTARRSHDDAQPTRRVHESADDAVRARELAASDPAGEGDEGEYAWSDAGHSTDGAHSDGARMHRSSRASRASFGDVASDTEDGAVDDDVAARARRASRATFSSE